MNKENYSGARRALKADITLDPNLPRDKFYMYEDMPGTSIRFEQYSFHIIDELPYIQRLLNDFEHVYDIPTVHTQFALTASEEEVARPQDRDAKRMFYDLVMVSDRVEGSVSATEALEYAEYKEIAEEFDALSCKILAHLRDTHEKGGIMMSEYYHYHQYVFSPGAPKGERLILVDTEPMHILFLEEVESRVPGSVPLELLLTLANCAKDIVTLEKKAGYISDARKALLMLVADISAEGHDAVERIKQAIQVCLEERDASLLDFIEEDFDFENKLLNAVENSVVPLLTLIEGRSLDDDPIH